MGAVAGLCAQAGHEVRGSDGPLYPPMSSLLAELGIPRAEGYRAENLDWGPDLLVLGNTCKADHVELAAARARGLRVVSFPELLAERFLDGRKVLVVAGTHGKTTTTSLLAHLLVDAGLDPGYLVGGIPANFGRSFALGRAPWFAIEGDEYDAACFDKRPKFVHYRPHLAILTSVEFDHADIYPTMADVERAFAALVERIPPEGGMLVCADYEPAIRLAHASRGRVERYAVRAQRAALGDLGELEWTGTFTDLGRGRHALEVWHDGRPFGRFEVGLVGAHNMANVLAVVATGHRAGLTPEVLARGLSRFGGVKRRQEVRGRVRGVTVIDDFAHHPTAIRETLRALRGVHGDGRLIAVFEPRSATSRRNVFQQDFPAALAEADETLLAPLFAPEKIAEAERLDVARVVTDLEARGRSAALLPTPEAMVEKLVREGRPGDTVVVMSSGGFGGLIEKLLAALGAAS